MKVREVTDVFGVVLHVCMVSRSVADELFMRVVEAM